MSEPRLTRSAVTGAGLTNRELARLLGKQALVISRMIADPERVVETQETPKAVWTILALWPHAPDSLKAALLGYSLTPEPLTATARDSEVFLSIDGKRNNRYGEEIE